MNEQTHTKGAWSLIGKIAVVLGVVWAGIQIWDYFTPKGPRINVNGEFTEIVFPEGLREKLQKSGQSLSAFEIEKQLPEKISNRYDIATVISDYVNKERQRKDVPIHQLMGIKSYWKFIIVNNGKKEAIDIKLQAPLKGYYRINGKKTQESDAKFENTISLGNLRPTEKIDIEVWQDGYLSQTTYAKDIRVTYPEGAVAVDYSKDQEEDSGILSMITLLLVVLFIGFVIGAVIQSKTPPGDKAQNKSDEKSSSETEVVNPS